MGVRARTRSTSTRRPTRSRPRGSARTRAPRTPTWGPAKTENADDDELGGQLGLAVLPGRQPLELPRQDCRPSTGGGAAAPAPARPRHGRRRRRRPDRRATSTAAADGRSTTRRTTPACTTIPAPKPVNIWYGPQGGCYGYPRNANGVGRLHRHSNTSPAPATYRALPVARSAAARRRSTAASTASRRVTSPTPGRPTGTAAGS